MLTILMGKSATGKDTLQQQLAKDYDIERVVTATTRPMREGEQDGRDYHFKTDAEFNELIATGSLIEYTEFNGVKYGCPKSSVDFDKDQCIILEPEGVQNFIKELGQENVFVVSMELEDDIRKLRAEGRGSFTEEKWQERLKNDNERFSEETVDELANMRLDLTFRMYGGESPSVTAADLIKALNTYKEDASKFPDEKRIAVYSSDVKGYVTYSKSEYNELETVKASKEIMPY